jgi:hypothetical protein
MGAFLFDQGGDISDVKELSWMFYFLTDDFV